MSLKMLSLKLAILLLLLTSQRGQAILNLSVDRMLCLKKSITFKLKNLLKHNRLGQPLNLITLYAYAKNKKLCVVRALSRYLEHAAGVRKGNTVVIVIHSAIQADFKSRAGEMDCKCVIAFRYRYKPVQGT